MTGTTLGVVCRLSLAIVALGSTAAIPPVTEQTRAALDRALGTKGVYVVEESAYEFAFPRNDVSVQVGRQRLSPTQAPRSWATFAPSIHHDAMVSGELVLLEDEVNPVMSVALDGGLEVNGLGATLLFEQPRLLTLNVTGEGTFQNLAAVLKKVLDQIRRVRAGPAASSNGEPVPPLANNIDPAPLNDVLSMRGMAVDGIYRAAIGRVALVNGTPIGREMGMSTSIVMFGSNDRAFVDADMIVSPDQLQRVLKALRSRDFTITSIRNHTTAEHPSVLFVRTGKQGAALDLAKGLRFALDVEVGAAKIAAMQGSGK
jgi:hypothetical protein